MELVVQQLGKRYGSRWALRDVSFSCGRGMLGLVGANGAGKTTLLRIVGTLLEQSQGSVAWNGLDSRRQGTQIRQQLGYLPQEFGFFPELTARKFLAYMASIKGIPADLARRRVDELLEQTNLERDADQKLAGFSGGMRQRVGIAQALLNDPELLILDEPTAGLDPGERIRFRTLLGSLMADRVVLLSTHIITDVEALAPSLLLLHEGRVLADASPEALKERARGHVWGLTVPPAMARELQARHTVSALVPQGDSVALRAVSATPPAPGAQPLDPTLEEAYLRCMQEAPAV